MQKAVSLKFHIAPILATRSAVSGWLKTPASRATATQKPNPFILRVLAKLEELSKIMEWLIKTINRHIILAEDLACVICFPASFTLASVIRVILFA